MPDERETPSYEVGYGRSPRNTRFQKGRSGNPAGRAPGRRNVKTLVMSELSRRVTVTKDGRPRRMAMADVIAKRWVEDAARGEPRAREQLLRLLGQIEATAEAKADSTFDRDQDREILARFRTRLVAEIEGGDNA